jgi:uncharacterized iron-regulated protein
MKMQSILFGACMALLAAPLWAASFPADVLARMRDADVVLLGEVHDNPAHHALQAEALEALRPPAVVWEMLSPETAARFQAGWLDDPEHMAQALDWAAREWPGFDLYQVVLKAARGSAIYGGLVPRQKVQAVIDSGIAVVFGSQAAKYGLMIPLAPADQAAREAEQLAAHCDAIPVAQLPVMVAIQRLRDAVLAQAVITAMDETGGPVVVITGNGHARTDQGIPEVLARVAPGLRVFALGQSEDGAITGSFDAVVDSPAVERPDPCEVFRNRG